MAARLIPSPRRGRTKVGVIGLIGSRAPLSRPFPIKGKGVQMQCNDMSPCSYSVGERKIMNHFGVGTLFSSKAKRSSKNSRNLCSEYR